MGNNDRRKLRIAAVGTGYRRVILLAFLAAAVLALPGCQVLEEMALVRPVAGEEEAALQEEPLFWEGQLEAAKTVNVSVPLSGKVQQIQVVPGEIVDAGDVLIIVDDRQAALNLKTAEAERARLQAELDRVRGEDALYRLEGEIAFKEALIEHKTARKTYSIALHLFETGQITETELEDTQRAAELAELKLARQQYRMDTMDNIEENEYNGAENELLALELDRARAALELARYHYDSCRVEAPISGRVAGIRIDQGEWLEAGTTALVVEQTDLLKLSLEIREDRLNLFRPGERVDVGVPAALESPLPGRVANITFLENNRFNVDIHLDNPGLLRPGMTARVVFE